MQYFLDNIGLVLVACLSGAMFFWAHFGNRLRGVKEVSCPEALQLINHKNALVLDVREPDEFKTGHILNSKNIPLGKLKERAGELERHRAQPVVVVCRTSNRSNSGCALLGKQGFGQTYLLKGGVVAWTKAGLPLEK
ncbi:MAG: rhodanese-like domain-containing protein [Nitrosomonadales bacterium]|nr:rhodanese-like domain-containing protein [Nitrosomonadales bacterium]